MFDEVLKFARKLVESVISEITKQINRVQNEVIQEALKIVGGITDTVWKSEDADAFKAEVVKMVVPSLNDIVGMNNKVIQGLNQAAEVIDRADQKIAQVVSDLSTQYGNIY